MVNPIEFRNFGISMAMNN